jgi:outer membrane protein TolC
MRSPLLVSKYSRIILGALALLGLAATAQAQAPAPAPMGPEPQPRLLSLDEALATARRNNRDLQQAKARVDQARTGIEQAWVALLPQVSGQGKYTHNYKEVTLNTASFATPTLGAVDHLAHTIVSGSTDPSLKANVGLEAAGLDQTLKDLNDVSKNPPVIIQKGEQLDATLIATVPLLVPYAYPALMAQRKTVEAAKYNLSATDATVLFATAQAYYACAGTDELVGARQHAVAVAQKGLDNAKARLEAGVVNRVEVTRAELQLVRAQQALLETFDSQASAYRALGTIMNLHEAVRVENNASASAPQGEAPVEQLTADALKLRPEFLALERTMSASDSTVKSNWWRWAPQLSAFGNVHVGNYAGFSGDKYSWAIGLQLDWLIYDGGLRDAQRHLAWAQRRESEAKLDLLRDQVADDVYNASRTVKTKRSAVATAERSVQLSKETLDLVTVQHEAGTATQLDLLQAQDALVGAEVALAQARFDLALGALQLDRADGTFPNNRTLK